MKDSITVEVVSVLPSTQLGRWKFSVVKVKWKSLLGVYWESKVSFVSVAVLFWLTRDSLWEEDS